MKESVALYLFLILPLNYLLARVIMTTPVICCSQSQLDFHESKRNVSFTVIDYTIRVIHVIVFVTLIVIYLALTTAL